MKRIVLLHQTFVILCGHVRMGSIVVMLIYVMGNSGTKTTMGGMEKKSSGRRGSKRETGAR